MKGQNVTIKMDGPFITCDKCSVDVQVHGSETHGEKDNGDITMRYYGWCPKCGKEYVWDAEYKFVSGVIRHITEWG